MKTKLLICALAVLAAFTITPAYAAKDASVPAAAPEKPKQPDAAPPAQEDESAAEDEGTGDPEISKPETKPDPKDKDTEGEDE